MTHLLGGVSATAFILLLLVLAAAIVVARLVPWIGTLLRFALTLGLLGGLALLILQRSAFDPQLASLGGQLNLDGQRVSGKELRVHMAADGHFWVRATVNGVSQRMLVDSGATVTALSSETAARLGLEVEQPIAPIILKTANGAVRADTATVAEMRIGNVVARRLPIVVSSSLGDINVLGMNFLSRLKSWRVEGDTLILTPHHPASTK